MQGAEQGRTNKLEKGLMREAHRKIHNPIVHAPGAEE